MVLILICTQSFLASARVYSSCDAQLGENTVNVTENFISYLLRLFDERVISAQDVEQLVQEIRSQNKVSNILQTKSQVGSEYLYHSQALQEYIDSKQLNHSILLTRLQLIVDHWKHEQGQRNQTTEKTKAAIVEIRFNPIYATTKLKHSFEMMITPVTQAMWVDVMKRVPRLAFSNLRDPNGILFNNGKDVFSYWENYAAGGVSWWDAIEFANKLSEMQGLPPAYDTSEIDFNSPMGPKGRLKINAPDGDIYQAEGYRLATVEEILSINEEHEIAYEDTSFSDSINPVAELPALSVDGYSFYDLHNKKNVKEWQHESEWLHNKGNIRPDEIEVRSILRKKGFPLIYFKHDMAASMGSNLTSFRLVRTIKNKTQEAK